MSWPPKQSELTADSIQIPVDLRTFLSTLLTGTKDLRESHTEQVHRLINSFGQDSVYGVTAGRIKTPKHILLPYAVKTLTNNVDFNQTINRFGHGVSYSQIEELTPLFVSRSLHRTQNTRNHNWKTSSRTSVHLSRGITLIV